ncbi:MAG: hypothetical protein MZV70_32925 [Desulfobacterales bacterium]|nr:hypothetical protein [Desulfobacterales bacterium]
MAEEGFEKSVHFTGYVESQALGRCLPAMDVGLCLGDHYFTRMYGAITTKIATYGMYRIPVIVTGVSFEGIRKDCRGACLQSRRRMRRRWLT